MFNFAMGLAYNHVHYSTPIERFKEVTELNDEVMEF